MAEASTQSDAAWPFLEAALAPVSADNPCGVDVTYDDDYQRLKGAVDGLSAAGAEGVDFNLMVELGRKVLASRSKDLRVAAFLAFGLERTRGAAGLAEGLAIVDAVTRAHWEGMYPPLKRITGRQNALQSLSDRLKDWVSETTYSPDSIPHLEDALARLRSLQQFTLESMDDKAPALSGLVQAIEGAIRKLPRAANGTEGAAPSAAPASAQPTPARAPAAAPVAADFQSPRDAERVVERAAGFLREKDATSPLSYLLLRDLRWTPIAELPPNDGGKTLIPPPASQAREALQRMADAADHQRLLAAAEDLFFEAPLLLDVQRYVVQALEALGLPMKAARDAVVWSLAGLLYRLPSLLDLTFNDGTPVADGSTRAWVETRIKSLFTAEEPAAEPSTGGNAAIDDAFARARSELGDGNLQRALALMQQGTDTDRGARDRYRRRLLSARLCMTARQFALARPLLEGLDAEIERFGIAEWEPDLAIDTWMTLHRCLSESGKASAGMDSQGLGQQLDRVFDKICRVDAGRALELIGKKG